MIHYYFWRIGQHESSLDTIRTHIDQAAESCSPKLHELLVYLIDDLTANRGSLRAFFGPMFHALVKSALPLDESTLYMRQPNAENWATLSKRILFSVPPPARDDAAALRFYRQRLECDHEHLVTLLGVARLQLESHEPEVKSADEAFRYARRAVELAPDYGACHLLLGDVYLYLDRPAESVREFQKAIELDGEDVHSLLRRAVAEHRSGQRGQAVETLRLAEEVIGGFDDEEVDEVAPLLDTVTSEIRGDFADPREGP
jgi:tetratricopeptide (TPR) repeat protein